MWPRNPGGCSGTLPAFSSVLAALSQPIPTLQSRRLCRTSLAYMCALRVYARRLKKRTENTREQSAIAAACTWSATARRRRWPAACSSTQSHSLGEGFFSPQTIEKRCGYSSRLRVRFRDPHNPMPCACKVRRVKRTESTGKCKWETKRSVRV